MKQHVHIAGMTCGNCQQSVTEKLSKITGVAQVKVTLATGEAVFQTNQTIPLEAIAHQLGTKYTVSQSPYHENQVSKWKQLRPLFLIFVYLIAASLLYTHSEGLSAFLRVFMGLFFVVFSFFKLLDYGGFPDSFATYDPIAKRLPFYGWMYPFIETGLGLCYLFSWQLPVALWITLILLGATTLGVIRQLQRKSTITCACLGTALKLPMTEATLIENAVMLIMAAAMLFGMV